MSKLIFQSPLLVCWLYKFFQFPRNLCEQSLGSVFRRIHRQFVTRRNAKPKIHQLFFPFGFFFIQPRNTHRSPETIIVTSHGSYYVYMYTRIQVRINYRGANKPWVASGRRYRSRLEFRRHSTCNAYFPDEWEVRSIIGFTKRISGAYKQNMVSAKKHGTSPSIGQNGVRS